MKSPSMFLIIAMSSNRTILELKEDFDMIA
ncbi:MAG: hypothetical protein RLZZ306_3291, partial [Bacteroidota bacterium]